MKRNVFMMVTVGPGLVALGGAGYLLYAALWYKEHAEKEFDSVKKEELKQTYYYRLLQFIALLLVGGMLIGYGILHKPKEIAPSQSKGGEEE